MGRGGPGLNGPEELPMRASIHGLGFISYLLGSSGGKAAELLGAFCAQEH